MAYGSSKPPGPMLGLDMSDLLSFCTVLKDGTPVVLQRLIMESSTPREQRAMVQEQARRGAVCTDPRTVESTFNLLNHEIVQGNSYPFEEVLSREKFAEYFFGYDVFVLRSTHSPPVAAATAESAGDVQLADPQFVGCFYVKPNYPGRSSHLCNGGFLVAPAYRGRGAGLVLGERFRLIAQRLGYRGSVFNLVFHDNPASLRLWEKLHFMRIGDVPGAGRHPTELGKSSKTDPHHYVTATMWFLDLTNPLPAYQMPWEAKYADTITALQAEHRSKQQSSKL